MERPLLAVASRLFDYIITERRKKSIDELKPKRKTRTSTAVKRRYNEKHYKKFQADIKKDLFEQITAYIEKEQISKSEFLQKAINELDK